MNISLSSRHTVHATDENGSTPKCLAFGSKGSEAYRTTTREVSCKKCLKTLADEAAAALAETEELEAKLDDLSDTVARLAQLPEGKSYPEVVADQLAEDAPIVAELNGRPAVWMTLHQGHQMWAAKDAPGLYTSKARATAAQHRATRIGG